MTLINCVSFRKRAVNYRNIPDAEELASSSAERDVSASKVVDRRLGEHGVVLKLGLAKRGAVAGDEDKLSCEPGMFLPSKT